MVDLINICGEFQVILIVEAGNSYERIPFWIDYRGNVEDILEINSIYECFRLLLGRGVGATVVCLSTRVLQFSRISSRSVFNVSLEC